MLKVLDNETQQHQSYYRTTSTHRVIHLVVSRQYIFMLKVLDNETQQHQSYYRTTSTHRVIHLVVSRNIHAQGAR